MKKKYYLKPLTVFCLLFFATLNCLAQCPPPSQTIRLDGNNIDALFKTNGAHFFTPAPDYDPAFIVPKGSGKSTFFAASLWLGGLTEASMLHLAAMMYGAKGNDFFAGPISNGGSETGIYYDRFWKISKAEIEYHKQHYANQGYTMPESISTWPAHGRAEYGESFNLAPYVNVSGNSSYTPLSGDYPLIRGDQAIFWINNDGCEPHTESGGLPLGVEILSMAYAYNSSDEALQNTIFISHILRNKSENNYYNFYAGFFSDFDIGYGYDDYIGCDTLLNLAYGYNGKAIDGNGEPHAYGEHPPAQGAMFLNQQMNAFMYFNNTNTVMGNPNSAAEYYNYMRAIWRDQRRLTLWGNGHSNSTNYTKFAFSGDPVTATGWTEVTLNGTGSTPNTPGDRRGVMSVGPLVLSAGESMCIDIALPFARDLGGDHIASVALLKQRATAIQQFYNNQNFGNNCSLVVGIQENRMQKDKLVIYPNPSNGDFTVTCEQAIQSIELYDVLGKKVFTAMPKAQTTQINTGLPKGLYIYHAVLQDNSVSSGKIIVQ